MKTSWARIALLLIVVAAAAVIRTLWLQSTPLWWDEFVTLGRAKLQLIDIWRSLSWQGPSDSSLDSSPPLLHFIIHSVLALGGRTDAWVKVPSVIFGTLTVLMLYPLGTRLFGGRSGLYASSMLAFSLYHVHYSREARPYALYLLLAVSSLWLLLRALETNRLRDWCLYALTGTATLYASYLGGATLAAQGAYLAALALARQLPRDRFAPAGASLGVIVLAYLPWLPGHLFHMELIYAPGGEMGLSWGFLGRALMEFATQGVAYLACAALGAVVGARRNPRGLSLLAFWLGFPILFALLLRTSILVNPRYLINYSPGLALLAGAGLDALVRGLSLGLPGRAAALVGLAAAVLLSWPSLSGLDGYYRRDLHGVRDDLLALAENAGNIDTLAFVRNRHQKVFAQWYLPRGLFRDLSRDEGLPYRRVMLLCGKEFVPSGLGVPETYGDLRAFRMGLVNESPLPAAGPYRAEFSDLSFYREASGWENMGPDLFQKTLSLYDPQRPGWAQWTFMAPPEGFARAVTLRCRLRLERNGTFKPTQANISLLAGSRPDGLAVLRTVNQADFVDSDELEVSMNVPRPSGDRLTLGLYLDPGIVHGGLDILSLELDFPDRPVDLSKVAGNLEGRAPLTSWTPGVERAGRARLYAFKPDEPLRRDFLAAHPGIHPVSELPGLEIYDPALSQPRIAVPPGGPFLFDGGKPQGLIVRGALTGQTLALGDEAIDLPSAPGDSTLCLSPGGQDRLYTSFDYSEGPGKPFSMFNVVKVPDLPCLTCSGENTCYLVYAIRSRRPVKAVRVEFCPEAYGEPHLENGVRLSLSPDGNRYRVLDSTSVTDSEIWEGKNRHVAWITLEQPSDRVYLRFELSSDKARLWAGPGYPMRLDAWLDPALTFPLKLPAERAVLETTGGPLSVYLSPFPLPDLDGLLAPH